MADSSGTIRHRRIPGAASAQPGGWLQVGGHGDPGETGLSDLVPWPDGSLRHAAVCYVGASATEPEHEHADLRYILATGHPAAGT